MTTPKSFIFGVWKTKYQANWSNYGCKRVSDTLLQELLKNDALLWKIALLGVQKAPVDSGTF
jgi:hypothetical protein